MNFNTESAKELALYDFLFLITIYFPNSDKHPLKWEISTTTVTLL